MQATNEPADEAFVDATRRWMERAVIGLGLCPFAAPVHEQGRVRYVLSTARSRQSLLDDLERELRFLHEADPAHWETTLLIHPHVLGDFLDYNDFLDVADLAVEELGLEGELQVASFHPHYQFADSAPDDVENCSNRSPYPTLHLLRESSVERALAAFPDSGDISRRNIDTLRRLGAEGWRRLWRDDPPAAGE